MLALACENQLRADADNGEFLKGEIENIPLPDAEAFRVLKPGGRLAVSDIVVRRAIPTEFHRSMELWASGVARRAGGIRIPSQAGAGRFRRGLRRAEDAKQLLDGSRLDAARFAPLVDEAFMSASFQATKPPSDAIDAKE